MEQISATVGALGQPNTIQRKVNNYMRIQELSDALAQEWKASKELCLSPRSNDSLGASALSSCRSQGLRNRDSRVPAKIGTKRKPIGQRRVKGAKYGGPTPDWS